jgi:hypothetical protein
MSEDVVMPGADSGSGRARGTGREGGRWGGRSLVIAPPRLVDLDEPFRAQAVAAVARLLVLHGGLDPAELDLAQVEKRGPALRVVPDPGLTPESSRGPSAGSAPRPAARPDSDSGPSSDIAAA